jgi:small multidrug resistance pump
MQAWLILGAAILCEVIGTTMMKLSESMTRWVWIPPMLAFYVLALVGLSMSLKTIEVGIAYAVWAGVGTLVIALIGVLCFEESVSPLKIASILLVVAGVVGLNLADQVARR